MVYMPQSLTTTDNLALICVRVNLVQDIDSLRLNMSFPRNTVVNYTTAFPSL